MLLYPFSSTGEVIYKAPIVVICVYMQFCKPTGWSFVWIRKGTISLPDCTIKLVILTLFLKMEGDEQVFAGQTVAESVLKNLNLPV